MSNLTLEQLRDERDIHELLVRYCRAGDRCDAELMKSVYWPEATDEHDSFYSGNAIAFVDFALAEMRQKTLRTVHTLTNVWIQLQGDVAQVESYVNGYHLMNTPGSKVEAIVSVRFLDRMEKRRGEWRSPDARS